MAPLPGAQVSIVKGQVQISGTGNPGYPFFIPGVAGHRPPRPPMDTIDDGGLARHVILDGKIEEAHDRLDFHKTLSVATAKELPENGTPVEEAGDEVPRRAHPPTCLPNGTCTGATFVTNGRPAGARRAVRRPVRRRQRQPIPLTRTIKGADIETDVVLNKKGWHFPQMRFAALWEDVDDYIFPTVDPPKPPEPLFMRANSGDCIEYWFANLVPHEYQLDDFQVRTPTDILGQHIHLVKFDVTSSDGSGNGFNYEDGTLSPGEVRERVHAIREGNGCLPATRATAPSPARWPRCTPSSASGQRPRRRPTGSAPRPRCSAGGPIRCATIRATTARCARSSPTTTSAPRPTSRPGSMPVW